MNVNGITRALSPLPAEKADLTKMKDVSAVRAIDTASAESAAAVYEPSKVPSVDSARKAYRPDPKTVAALQAESDERTERLRDLVSKTLAKQGQLFTQSSDMYALLREGKLKVDPETAAKAKEEIGEDGYWGVKQTSERLFSFATALTGGDPAKAEKMKDAVIKGFESAKKAWGGELPEISQETYDATMAKFDDWIAQNKSE